MYDVFRNGLQKCYISLLWSSQFMLTILEQSRSFSENQEKFIVLILVIFTKNIFAKNNFIETGTYFMVNILRTVHVQ